MGQKHDWMDGVYDVRLVSHRRRGEAEDAGGMRALIQRDVHLVVVGGAGGEVSQLHTAHQRSATAM
jgi:hypothetical protein